MASYTEGRSLGTGSSALLLDTAQLPYRRPPRQQANPKAIARSSCSSFALGTHQNPLLEGEDSPPVVVTSTNSQAVEVTHCLEKTIACAT